MAKTGSKLQIMWALETQYKLEPTLKNYWLNQKDAKKEVAKTKKVT